MIFEKNLDTSVIEEAWERENGSTPNTSDVTTIKKRFAVRNPSTLQIQDLCPVYYR